MSKRRPCWVVIAKGTKATVERSVRRHLTTATDALELELVQGVRDYTAIIEREPGSESSGEDKLAAALSLSTKAPAYALWLGDDMHRVQAFSDGEYQGEIHEHPDNVAWTLGCKFPGLRASGHVDLKPEKPVQAVPGAHKILRWTGPQWAQIMKESGWDVLLDDANDETPAEVLAALRDDDPTMRAVACRIAEVLGGDALGKLRAAIGEQLAALSNGDPDQKVQKAARTAAAELAASART